jgi:AraC-like DNA-binding protein
LIEPKGGLQPLTPGTAIIARPCRATRGPLLVFFDTDGGGAFEFSADQLPEEDRVDLWRDTVARQMRIDSQPLPGCALKVDVRGYAWPGLKIAKASLSSTRDERTRELIANGDDEINLVINLSGPVTAMARGSAASLGEGDGFAVSSLEPAVFTRPSPGSAIGLSLPRQAIDSRVRHLDAGLARIIPARSEFLQLLRNYSCFLLDNKSPIPSEVRDSIVVHVSELVALVLRPSREIASAVAGLGNPAARLAGIKADVIENSGNRNLTTDWLAQRHNLSARYIQMLFESEQTTLSAFLLERRLTCVHQMLSDLRQSSRTISAIAFECGFGDLSYFNRAFRNRYGMTPSDARVRAL